MKHYTRSGIATTSLFLTLTAAANVTTQDSNEERGRTSNRIGSQSERNDMKEIGDAYRDLQEATLRKLQTEARTWPQSDVTSDSLGQATTSTRDSGRSGQIGTNAMQGLESKELLIAACAEGLVAGAPTRTSLFDTTTSPDSLSTDDGRAPRTDTTGTNEPSRPGGGSLDTARTGDAGETVGTILVCPHTPQAASTISSTSDRGESGVRQASSDSSAATQDAAFGRLEPGVYCVKLSGKTVSLSDRSGRVVLRSTVETRADTMSRRRIEGVQGQTGIGQEESGSRDSDATVLGSRTPQWEQIFGSITKEAMSSLGWSRQSSVSTVR